MENASKALIMAGGVLIGILLLSLIVFSYNQLIELARLDHQQTVEEQQTNYNAQWEKYNGPIYGTDVMSMANQITDYNATQAEKEGYTPITANIEIKKMIETVSLEKSDIIETYITKADIEIHTGNYSITEFYHRMQTIQKGIEKMQKNASIPLKKVGERTAKNVKISTLANMRRDEMVTTYQDIDESAYNTIRKHIDAYQEVLNLYQDVKNKKFTSQLEYDNTTGRIVHIIVVEK